jgi:hypothetical protein
LFFVHRKSYAGRTGRERTKHQKAFCTWARKLQKLRIRVLLVSTHTDCISSWTTSTVIIFRHISSFSGSSSTSAGLFWL